MRVIVGVDGTDRGLLTLEEGVALARDMDWELAIVVYSTDDTPLSEVETTVRDRLEALSFEATVERLPDGPGSRIVELAETENYDRIILPGGRQSPLGKIQIDNTVQFVLLNARTSVTLIR